MKKGSFRLAILAAMLVFFLLSLLILTWMTGTFVGLWNQLQSLPDWVKFSYLTLMTLVLAGFAWLFWWFFRPASRGLASRGRQGKIKSFEALEEKVQTARDAGVETQQIEQELAELRRRKSAGTLYIAFFGEISSGKSTLIKALLPDTEVRTHVLGGTTREISEYLWESPAGDHLVIVDMPGLNEIERKLDQLAIEEAQRAHLVLFVADGDLTATQYEAVKRLNQLDKPLMLLLNKSDWYSEEECAAISASIRSKQGLNKLPLAWVSAAGEELVTRLGPGGSKERVRRVRKPELGDLRTELQRLLDSHGEALEQLRDASVFVLAGKKLDAALMAERSRRATKVVSTYAKKAVVVSLATVAPGTDLIIQGLMATRMIRELSSLYEAPVRDVDTQLLIELVQQHVGTTTTLVLAVAGNALKAFPGLGTVSGALLHAVAYGVIFNALGKSVSETLRTRGDLRPVVASTVFKDRYETELKSSVGRFARMAYGMWRNDNKKQR